MTTTLVIGGARSGIGQSTTNRLLDENHRVLGTFDSNDVEQTQFVESNSGVEWAALDLSDPDSVINDLGRIESVDRVALVDFYFYMENPNDFDLSEWNRSLFVNLTVPKLIGHFAKTRWTDCKSVVFVTSSEAATGSFGAHAYAATKAATHNLTKSLANVAAGKCRFNSLAAGWIGGVMDTDEVFNMSRAITPLGRLGDPVEVANGVAWLLSDQSSFVNGATVFVDGGYTGVDNISKYEFESEFGKL